MKKVLISGGNGKFAQQLVKLNTKYNLVTPGKEEMDITDIDALRRMIQMSSPDIFLHAAAYTRPMKKHQKNPHLSIKANIIGTCNVVLACMEYGIKLVYISTDYVYPGVEGDYKEEAPLSPYTGNNDGVTKYGWSKLGGEAAVRIYDNSLILRVCMCNYPFPHANAAVDIKKSLIFDYDAAKIVLSLLEERGVINVGGDAQSVYDFASPGTPGIGRIKKEDILDVDIAPNTTMNLSRMKSILGEK